MFFGLEIKSKEKVAKPITLTNSLQLSQAVLLPQGAKKEPVCLVVEHDSKQFVLCVLDPTKSWQSPLNLVFETGSEVKFFLRGQGTVHLTGYEIFDDLDDMSMSMSEDEEITSEEDEEAQKQIMMSKKSPKAKTNGLKSPNKSKESNKLNDNQDDDDDDDDDESDVDFDEDDDDDDDDDETDSDEEAETSKGSRGNLNRRFANNNKQDDMSDDESGSDFEIDDDSDF